LFSSFLAGAALRGCQVLAIAPSPENSTFTGAAPLQSRTQELMARLLLTQLTLKEEIDSIGGMLKVGVYNRNAKLGDLAIFDEFTKGVERHPFVKQLFPFHDNVYAEFDKIHREAKAAGYQPHYYSEDAEERKPKLHMKINFFLSNEVKALMKQPGWEEFLRAYLMYREKFTILEKQFMSVQDVPEDLREMAHEILLRFQNSLNYEEQAHAMGYLTIGSQNHNYRSLIMDGEVALVVANRAALNVLMDMFFLSGITTWVDDMETLEQYLPAYEGFTRSFSRYLMKTL
jgi:hypothetical protein